METALLLIDVQKGFQSIRWPSRNNPQAEENMLAVLTYFRQSGQDVIHICHKSQSSDGAFYQAEDREFMAGFEPLAGETVFEKSVNSAFIGTDLEYYLLTEEITNLVIVGLTLPHCVSTTTRMATNLGFKVILPSDATATFSLPDLSGKLIGPDILHQVNLISLNHELAEVLTTADYLEGK